MVVTEILPLNKKKSRIYLDHEKAFILYNREIRRYCLSVSSELSEQTYQRILTETLLKRARSRALHLLERQDRTEWQLREKLRQSEYPEETIEAAVSFVKSYHYIDDARFARHYICTHCEKKSKRQICMELIRKGIQKEHIDQLYAEVTEELGLEDKDNQLIQKWIEKKHIDLNQISGKEYQRFYRFLLGKGFDCDEINHVLRYH